MLRRHSLFYEMCEQDFLVFSKSSTVIRPWNGYGLAGGAARRVRSRALPCSFGEYKQSCAAWMAVNGDAGKSNNFCASCTKGIVGATRGATWGRM